MATIHQIGIWNRNVVRGKTRRGSWLHEDSSRHHIVHRSSITDRKLQFGKQNLRRVGPTWPRSHEDKHDDPRDRRLHVVHMNARTKRKFPPINPWLEPSYVRMASRITARGPCQIGPWPSLGRIESSTGEQQRVWNQLVGDLIGGRGRRDDHPMQCASSFGLGRHSRPHAYGLRVRTTRKRKRIPPLVARGPWRICSKRNGTSGDGARVHAAPPFFLGVGGVGRMQLPLRLFDSSIYWPLF